MIQRSSRSGRSAARKRDVTGPVFTPRNHDHRRCLADAIAAAEAVCRRKGARLTDQRRRVLELVWRSHAPVGAYDILEDLRRDGTAAAPPTVYRALAFLEELGLVHRVESLNAFVGCSRPDSGHETRFLICERCGTAAEFEDEAVAAAIEDAATRAGFQAARGTVEIFGTCPDCRRAEP